MSSFIDTLRRYKRDGCTLLVTGAVDTTATARATRKLLGSPAERRVRLLGLTDPAFDGPAPLLPGGVSRGDDDVTVLDYRDQVRSPAFAAPLSARGDDASLERFSSAVADVASAVEPSPDADCRLRVGLVSLDPVVDAEGLGPAADMVAAAGTAVSDARGMFHAHLGVPDDDALVDEFAPLFDARIELRRRRGHVPEQRWHLPEETSPWLEL